MPKIPIAVKQKIKKKPQNVFVCIASFNETPPTALPSFVFLGLFFDPLEIFFHGRKETKISSAINTYEIYYKKVAIQNDQ